jgi:thioesterase domain-containing protein
MAAFYAQAVMSELAHHTTQHVVLAGFSAGCALLLPLRDALRLRGCDVDRLVVLDAPAPERPSLDELSPWMQPRPAEQGAAPGTLHALNFRRVFARCLMNPTPDPAADNTPLLAILVGRHAKEKQTGWQHFWPTMALHCLLLPQRQHHNFLHPPSDARIARVLERWCRLPHA